MSSPYVPTTWVTGDVVTATKANNWETQYADVFDSGAKTASAAWTWANGTTTTSRPVHTITQTWNAGGVSFVGVSHVFTETAAGAGSRYFQILGGASGVTDEFFVQQGGVGFFAASIASPVINATTGFRINSAAATGTFPRGNSINYVSSTLTIADAAAAGNVMYASGTNAVSANAGFNLDSSGRVGLGTSATGSILINVAQSPSGGTGQSGLQFGNFVATSAATASITGVYMGITTAASTTTANLRAYYGAGIAMGGSAVLTRLTVFGTIDYGSYSTNSAGFFYGDDTTFTGNWAFYNQTTKASYFNGGVSVGTTTAAGTGNILIGTGNNQLGVGSILADAQFSLTGTFTGNSGNTLGYIAGLSLTTTMSPDVSRNAFVCRLAPTIVEAASGTHTLLAALRIILTITNGGATTTDAAGMDVNTFAAAAGTTTASGIRVDGPTGATNNYAINVLSGNSLFVGNITANALIPASSTVPTNGMYLATTNAVAFATNSGERVRFHASGGVSIGNTTDPGGTSLSVTGAGTFGAVLTVNAGGVTAEGVSQFTHASGIALSVFSQTGAGSTPMAIYQRHGSNGDYLMSFRNSSAAEYGSVTQVNGTTIAFNTTSDQRLKRDHGRCVDLTLLRRLIVHDAAWAADGMRYPMFFAQEVMHEAPFIVTAGDPDWATNPDVRRPWMTHAVELIPALTAGWQDHDARLEALERRAA